MDWDSSLHFRKINKKQIHSVIWNLFWEKNLQISSMPTVKNVITEFWWAKHTKTATFVFAETRNLMAANISIYDNKLWSH